MKKNEAAIYTNSFKTSALRNLDREDCLGVGTTY